MNDENVNVTICLNKDLLKDCSLMDEIKKEIMKKENVNINNWTFLENEETLTEVNDKNKETLTEVNENEEEEN